ncbi:MAG TPA: UrcA family protein [Rhizomicrobium sp.]|jgi:UrcA family protein|nr:UrcA family protein [Rhizomicrobium sp.]
MSSLSKSALRLALLAGAVGLVASSASAQGYYPQNYYPQAPQGYYPTGPGGYFPNGAETPLTPYSSGPNESVTVTVPRFRAQTTPLNGPMEEVSLSMPVHYTFRDLVDPVKSQVLRWRVWNAARDVCHRLAVAYPVYTLNSAPSCFHEAYGNAMSKIDARMAGARLAYWYGE